MMKNRRKDVLHLVLGAIMLAVFLAVYIIVPVGNGAIQSVVIIVASLPLTLYTLYCGIKKALLVIVAGLILSGFLLQPPVFTAYGAPALVIGLIGGWIIKRGNLVRSVIVISILHLLQNGLELLLTQWMTGIDLISGFSDVVDQGVKMVSMYFSEEKALIFSRDFFYSCIPVVLIGAAAGKGVLTCYFIHMVTKSKQSPFRFKEEDGDAFLKGLNPKTMAWICLGIEAVYGVVAWLFLSETVAYHILFPIATVVILCVGLLYLYYYYARELATREMTDMEKYIRGGLLLVFAPFAMLLIPLKELSEKKEEKSADGSSDQPA